MVRRARIDLEGCHHPIKIDPDFHLLSWTSGCVCAVLSIVLSIVFKNNILKI